MSFLYDLIDDVTKNLTEELERVKRERDAAIADLKHGDNCDICAHTACVRDCDFECDTCTFDCKCRTCRDECNWEWRGIKEDTP